jgi:hypothetical protein
MKIYLLKWRCNYPNSTYTPDQKEKVYRTEVGVRRRIAEFQKHNTRANCVLGMTYTNIELYVVDAPKRRLPI